MAVSSHLSRWLIAIVAAPILLWAILAAPPVVFYVLITLVGAWAWWEYNEVVLGEKKPGLVVVSLAGWLVVAAGASIFDTVGGIPGLAVAFGLGAIYFLLNYGKIDTIIHRLARFALGHLYISFCFIFIIFIYHLEFGRYWVLFSLLITFIGDTFAFYAGRTWGRHLLYPSVSPKKTWEGLAGGVIGSGLTALVTAAFLLPVAWYQAMILGMILAFWGTAGDFFESLLKREAGIKDSGKLLGGHGGIMDRIDALVFNLPVIYFFAAVWGA